MKVRYLLKKMKNNTILLILGFLTCIILTFFVWHNYEPREIEKTDTIWQTKTDTFWKDTTITKEKLVPKEVFITKVDTFYKKDGSDTIFKTENKKFQDTLICEKDTAELQIFTSGIKSNVDSISLKLRKSEIIKTNTVEITKYIERPKTLKDHFKVGVGVGYGYGMINKNFDVYTGISINYEL